MKRVLVTFISIIIATLTIGTLTIPALAKKSMLPPDVASHISQVPALKITKSHVKTNMAANNAKESNAMSPPTDFVFNPTTQTIEEYIGSDAVVNIPSTIEGVAVLHIGEQAFVNLLVTSVTIPNGVESIDNGAFGYCSALTNVSVPDSVTIIDANAFYECSALENITLPTQLETIGTSAFQYCYSLKSIDIPNSVKTLGNASFYWCFALEDLTLSNQLTNIEEYSFELCPIKIIKIPDSVTHVGYHAFWASSVTESLTLSKNLAYIGEQAFYYMPLLKSLVIPDSVTYIDTGAFMYGESLESITLSKNLTYIGPSSFSQCIALKSITIPENVNTIGDQAFAYDSTLKSAIFTGNAPATWGINVFQNVATGFTVYYYAENSGFSTPIFKEYPCYPLYQVNLAPAAGGSVAVSSNRAASGSTITVTTTPDTAYVVKSVYYTDLTGKHDITSNSFLMPASNVTVTAEFELNSISIILVSFVVIFFLATLAYIFWLIVRK